jgi:hypothetical protein
MQRGEKMKTVYMIGLAVMILIAVGISAMYLNNSSVVVPNNSSCTYGQLNYYFRVDCSHCQRVLADGSLDKVESEFGVEVNKLEVVEWGMYGIYSTPTFEFGGQRITGYKTFDQLKGLLGC